MRTLVFAAALMGAVALPAIAEEQSYRLDVMTEGWATAAAETPWRDAKLEAESLDGDLPADEAMPPASIAPSPGFSYAGDGWPLLDGWMRGDPTLRHWVMHRFDLDADGWLTVDEAAMARRGFYAIADGNRSDRITSEEFVAGWSVVRRELQSFYAIGTNAA